MPELPAGEIDLGPATEIDLGAAPVNMTPETIDSVGKSQRNMKVNMLVDDIKKLSPAKYGVLMAAAHGDPFSLRQYALRHLGKFITPAEPDFFPMLYEAIDKVQAQTPLTSWKEYPGLAGSLGKIGAEFAVLPEAKAMTAIARNFALQSALQAPSAQEEQGTLGEFAKGRAKEAIIAGTTGLAVGGAGKFISNPLWRIPTVTGGFMALTAARGGDKKQILESGLTILGFEAVHYAQKGLYGKAAQAAKEFNPDLEKAEPTELQSRIKSVADIASEGEPSPPMQQETITSPAIRADDQVIYEGDDHTAIRSAHPEAEGGDEGFMTSEGRFVDRTEGAQVAFDAGQTPAGVTELHSEHLKGTAPPPEQPPVQPPQAPSGTPEFEDVKARMLKAVTSAKEVSPEVRKEQKGELKQRVARGYKIQSDQFAATGSAEQAIAKSKSALKGELTEYDQRYPSIRDQFTPPEIDSMFQDILNNPKCTPRERFFYRINTQKALQKMIDGSYLTRGDVLAIENQFGEEWGKTAKERMPTIDKLYDRIYNVMGGMKTLTQLYNIHFVGRQAAILGGGDWVLYAKSLPVFTKAYFSEEFAQKLKAEYQGSPLYDIAVDTAKIQFPEEAGIVFKMGSDVEETFPVKSKIPGARASQRSFVIAGNWYRMQFFEKMYEAAKLQEEQGGPALTDERLERMGSVINSFTGRSNTIEQVKALRNASQLLNLGLYSPRMTVSRWESFFQAGRATAAVAKDLIKSGGDINQIRYENWFTAKAFASYAGSRILLMYALKEAFPDTIKVETDIRSADFGKIRIGNTRVDLFAGMLQPVRLTALLLLGERKTEQGKLVPQPRLGAVANYFKGRESPALQELTDWSLPTGRLKEWYEKMGIPPVAQVAAKKAWQVFPIPFQEVGSAAVEDGWPMLLLTGGLSSAAASVGISAYAYEPTPPKGAKPYRESLKKKKGMSTKEFFTGKE